MTRLRFHHVLLSKQGSGTLNLGQQWLFTRVLDFSCLSPYKTDSSVCLLLIAHLE